MPNNYGEECSSSKSGDRAKLRNLSLRIIKEVLGKRVEERFEVSLESNFSRQSGVRGKQIDSSHDHEDDPFTFSFGWLNEDDRRSKIALRFRPATDLDLKFMLRFELMVKNCDYSYFLRRERHRNDTVIEGSFGTKTCTRSG